VRSLRTLAGTISGTLLLVFSATQLLIAAAEPLLSFLPQQHSQRPVEGKEEKSVITAGENFSFAVL